MDNLLRNALACLSAGFLLSTSLVAQEQRTNGARGAGGAPPVNVETEEGIPVTNPLVVSKCGTCHAKDAKGNLSRISWERATPEGWEEAIKRMVRLNGLKLEPAEARTILKYLSTYHGLAPEEAKGVMYIPEHRMVDETNIPNDAVRGACTTCHAFGRPLSWRRSKNDWQLLANLHVALYAQAEAHFRRINMPGGGAAGGGGGAGGGAGAPPGTAAGAGGGRGAVAPGATPAAPAQDPVDAAMDFLGANAALHTPEWAAWRSSMRAPKLAGKWLVSASIPGRGKYFGEMIIEPGAAEDEFKTRINLKSLKDGSTLSRSGQGLVYAGYSWRGRSKATAGAGKGPDDPTKDYREAMFISSDQSSAEGRWFWGEYQEFGVEVKMIRASTEPSIVGLDIYSLKTGSQGARVRIIGESFPAKVAADDIDFGTGVKVRRVVSRSSNEIVAEVDVAADAVPGKRDVFLNRSVLKGAVAIYDKLDYIKVTPETALAHLGSETHPKGYQQFEAIGYQRGADGKLRTADDVELGPVDVDWSVEEFMAVYGDDDKAFVGNLSATALFTPASDGPNPERKFSRNNYGDVWVVATSKTEKDKLGKPLSGRCYLVVTVPTYIRWDQPEVSQ
jgi:quinohemoprotein amine dehydrogenase